MWFNNMLDIIGNTPLVRLNKVTEGINPLILAKLEFYNPGGSIKDRTAFSMITQAEISGQLKTNGTIVETTSGNTGIGVAWQASVKGYQAIIIAGANINPQKEKIMKALGAQVHKCQSYQEQFALANKIVNSMPGAVFINQMDNQYNMEAHFQTTGPEIWEQTGGKVDYVVAGLGSGGTISGISQFLKKVKPEVTMIGVDPVGSVYHGYFKTGRIDQAGDFNIEGIGNVTVQKAIHFDLIDDIIQVSDDKAYQMCRRLLMEEGLFVGASSGAIVYGALKLAAKIPADKIMVAILPDTGFTYLNQIFGCN